MSWLSPVQWAKWTWSAVTGGSGDDAHSNDNSDSEGTFETPEAESPGVVKLLSDADQFVHKNSKRAEVDALNNPTGSSDNSSSFALNRNLDLTRTPEASSRSNAAAQPQRPPSLPVHSPLSTPDPSEVDDEAPAICNPSPDSKLLPSRDLAAHRDLLNGNVNSDCAKAACYPQGSVVSNGIITNSCKVKPERPTQKDLSGQDDGHATDEEKLASSSCVKADQDQSSEQMNQSIL